MSAQKQLLFASNNRHKIEEVRQMIPPRYHLLGLHDICFEKEIPEPFDTFEDNARAKAAFLFEYTGLACFADDSGLEVDALDFRPGVFSARYAGEHKCSEDNVRKVLDELSDRTERRARFIAVIAYQKNIEETYIFKGAVEGSINFAPAGSNGFGYDPIFIPSGFDQTFAELPTTLKNNISHRAKAMSLFLDFLSTQVSA
jgi:XTP/dITP diphosphohydrolase